MSELRAELRSAVEQLLVASATSHEVTLDALGDAVGSLAVSYPEIDVMMAMLEAEGRKVVGAPALKGERLLAQVLTTIRALAPQLGRRPTHLEIAEHASLSVDEVRHALTLAKIMQR